MIEFIKRMLGMDKQQEQEKPVQTGYMSCASCGEASTIRPTMECKSWPHRGCYSLILEARIRELENGIRAHRDASGHNLCWYAPELWNLLPDKAEPKPEVPETKEFLDCCAKYRASLDKEKSE